MGTPAEFDAVPEGYDVLALLGQGASGTVVLALDPAGKRVAIKLLRGGMSAQPALLARFQREARLMARLDHPHIVHVDALIETPGGLALVMEYVEGGDLEAAVGQLPVPTSLKVLSELASAVDYAHRAGIVHRDLKPGNVLIDGTGRCRLTDFGIARFVAESFHAAGVDTGIRTVTGTILGTPTYLSPEAATAEPNIDGRADLYSLAVIAYELLTGRPPFVGSNVYGLLVAHAHQPAPPPSQWRAGFPEEVERPLLRALAKRAPDRQPDVATFWAELSSAADEAWPGWRERVEPEVLAAVCRRPAALVEGGLTGMAGGSTLAGELATLPPADLFVFRPPRVRRWPRSLVIAALVVLAAVGGYIGVHTF